VGVANFFLSQSIGNDETNTFQLKLGRGQSIGIDETNKFQLKFCLACGRGKLFLD